MRSDLENRGGVILRECHQPLMVEFFQVWFGGRVDLEVAAGWQ